MSHAWCRANSYYHRISFANNLVIVCSIHVSLIWMLIHNFFMEQDFTKYYAEQNNTIYLTLSRLQSGHI